MKLLFCLKCNDIFNLSDKEKVCSCGRTGGRYTNDIEAIYWGDCKPLGFDNASLKVALITQPHQGKGKSFEAFVIPKRCPTMDKINR